MKHTFLCFCSNAIDDERERENEFFRLKMSDIIGFAHNYAMPCCVELIKYDSSKSITFLLVLLVFFYF